MREENIRLIFGLKLRQLRQEKSLSLAALSKIAGMSASYLNEIEKGKKYPKTEKILVLAEALNVPYDELVSLKLTRNLAPLNDLLTSHLITDLPLNIFGFDLGKMVEWLYDSPAKIGAFISTIVEIARNYEKHKGDFYFKALRSYQEINDNYFHDLEEAVETFIKQYEINTDKAIDYEQILGILCKEFNFQVEEFSLEEYPELKSSRYVYIPGSQPKLLLNPQLNTPQRLFVIGRELAFNMLNIADRPHYSMLLQVESFDHVLNNFRAAYCAMALAISRENIIKDLENFFKQDQWDEQSLLYFLKRYRVSPELLFSRMAGIIPKHFGLSETSYMRFHNQTNGSLIRLTKQIHINGLSDSYTEDIYKHHCRRWVPIQLLDKLQNLQNSNSKQPMIAAIQRSQYIDSDSEYLCFAIARPMHPTPNLNAVSMLGFRINSTLKKKIKFWNDPAIPQVEVNTACENCSWIECEQRQVPPTGIQAKEKKEQIHAALSKLQQSHLG